MNVIKKSTVIIVLIFTNVITSANENHEFPNGKHIVEKLPRHHRLRPEGHDPLKFALNPLNILGYLKKYFEPKFVTFPKQREYFNSQKKFIRKLLENQNIYIEDKNETLVRIGLVGDIMWIRDSWDSFLHEDVKASLSKTDILIGNLETPIATSCPVVSGVPDWFHYNSDPGLLKSFNISENRNLFSAVTLANNHVLDCGDQGLDETMKFAQKLKIKTAGVQINSDNPKFIILKEKGVKIGLYSATFGANADLNDTSFDINVIRGLAPEGKDDVNLNEIKYALKKMDQSRVDLKIVSLHWGFEFEMYPTQLQMQIARRILRLGADIILGAHSHTIQPFEICLINDYDFGAVGNLGNLCNLESDDRIARKGLIIYSAGNFTSSYYHDLYQFGAIYNLELFYNSDLNRIDWKIYVPELVLNLRSDPKDGQRKLTLAKSYLNKLCQVSGNCQNKYHLGHQFLIQHLLYEVNEVNMIPEVWKVKKNNIGKNRFQR